VETLRRAAEAAPKVLPAGVGEAAATMFDLLRQWSGIPATVVAGGASLAAEVLALAEQQQTRRDAAVRIAGNEFQRVDIPLPVRPDDLMGRVVDALAAAGLLHTAPEPGITAEQVAYIKAATLQEEANWWETVRPTTVGRTQFGTWLRGRADVHLRAAGIPVQEGEK
jgi:hypothetical protein